MISSTSELIYEYRLVLTIWQEAKERYGAESKEALAALDRMRELEAAIGKQKAAA